MSVGRWTLSGVHASGLQSGGRMQPWRTRRLTNALSEGLALTSDEYDGDRGLSSYHTRRLNVVRPSGASPDFRRARGTRARLLVGMERPETRYVDVGGAEVA
jgi:hypothetical protein